MKTTLRHVLALAAFAAFAATGVPARATDFLDITSLTTGINGTFTGTLGGVSVTGAITNPNLGFTFNGTGTNFFDSTINNSSPQYSYSSVFMPSAAAADKVGYTFFPAFSNPATIVINFGSAVLNPIFNVAALNATQYDFSQTAGLGGLTLLSGNGGADGDGILVSGNVISDANSNTFDVTSPATPPPTTGARSAYGSVQLNGSFTSLTFNVTNPTLQGNNGPQSDGGSFTLSTNNASIPEPAFVQMSVLVAGLGGAGLLRYCKRRARNAS